MIRGREASDRAPREGVEDSREPEERIGAERPEDSGGDELEFVPREHVVGPKVAGRRPAGVVSRPKSGEELPRGSD